MKCRSSIGSRAQPIKQYAVSDKQWAEFCQGPAQRILTGALLRCHDVSAGAHSDIDAGAYGSSGAGALWCLLDDDNGVAAAGASLRAGANGRRLFILGDSRVVANADGGDVGNVGNVAAAACGGGECAAAAPCGGGECAAAAAAACGGGECAAAFGYP